MSDSVMRTLRTALEADPSDAALREHLVRLLLGAGEGAEALALLRGWLAQDPTQQVALGLAVQAADLAGDAAAAAAYQTVLNALYQFQEGQRSPQPRRVPALSAEGQGAESQDESGPEDDPRGEDPRTSLHEPTNPFDARWQPVAGGVTLRDVVGMDGLKERLERSLLGPLRRPELAQAYGQQPGGGLLLYGPPGCGKTHLARAVAGELGAAFLEVTVADVLDMWLGNSEHHVRDLFASARRRAPCVVFFDEVDALGRGRQLSRHAPHSVTQTLLRELDGLGGRAGVFVLAATNAPWDVDAALKRPGRLGVNLFVPPPDLAARAAMVRTFMQGRPSEGLDPAWLARHTEHFSGADLRQLCEDATGRALGRALRRGGLPPVEMQDFRAALKAATPSTREWLALARNHAVYANEGGSYDELAAFLREQRLL